jgi:hypothetical protein
MVVVEGLEAYASFASGKREQDGFSTPIPNRLSASGWGKMNKFWSDIQNRTLGG